MPGRVVRIDGVEFLEGATSGAGTELGDGLVVAEGSRLLADPFPTPRPPSTAGGGRRGWTAQILVTGDPDRVLAAYGTQAHRLGLPVPSWRCDRSGSPDDDVATVMCNAWSGDSKQGRTLGLRYLRAGRATGRAPRSHLLISVDTEGAAAPGVGSGAPDVGDAVPLPWGTLATVGQAFEPGTYNNPGMAVAPGSSLVGPPDQPSVTDLRAILRVDGHLATVIDAYKREGNSVDATHRRLDLGDVTVDEYYWTNGDTYTLTSYQRPGRPTWLVVEHGGGD